MPPPSIYFYFKWMGILAGYMSVQHMQAEPWRPEEHAGPPGTGVLDSLALYGSGAWKGSRHYS